MATPATALPSADRIPRSGEVRECRPAAGTLMNGKSNANGVEWMNDDLDIGADGEFTPYLKFNAKSAAWSWHDQDGAAVLTSPRFVMDLANIQTAWVRFDEGSAP